jgi:hypothetical protein
VRVDVVPSRAGFDLSGWTLEVASRGASGAAAEPEPRRFSLAEAAPAGGPPTVTIAGLAAGDHTLRLVPPPVAAGDRAESVVAHDIVVAPRASEQADDPAAIATLEAAARHAGGALVLVADAADLPATVAGLIEQARPRSQVGAAGPAAGSRWQGGVAATHAVMLALALAVALAWWPPKDAPRGGAGRGR